jgi:hypothetical protein
MLLNALSWLGITKREPNYAPAKGEWNPSDTSRGVDRVADNEDGTTCANDYVNWLSGHCKYPIIDSSLRAENERPGGFRLLGPSLEISKGNDDLYW